MDKDLIGSQTDLHCDICKHKEEVNDASHVCKQCRFFLCRECSSKHNILSTFKDHVLFGLTGIDRDAPTASGVRTIEGIDKKVAKPSGTDDSNVVDSDYVCTGGLETFFSAPANFTLTKVSESALGIAIDEQFSNIFCLPDGRFCIHCNDEIVIYSCDCNRLYAIDCSRSCAVIHTEGDIIAILNSFLYIDRCSIDNKEAELIDTIKLERPDEGNETHCVFSMHQPFAYDDGYYVVFFRLPSRKWCIFSITGKLLFQVRYYPDPNTMTNREVHYNEYISHFRQCSELYVVRFNRSNQVTQLICLNRFGKFRKIFECPHSVVCPLFFDGEYILFLTNDYCSRLDLIVQEVATTKTRIFEISSSGEVKFFSVVQKNLHQIMIFLKNKVQIFRLSSHGC